MSYKIGWYIPGRVLYVRHPEHISVELIEAMNADIERHLAEGQPLVHLISDTTPVKTLPPQLLKLKDKAAFLGNPALGWLVTVTTNPMIRFFGAALPQLGVKTRYAMVGSVGEVRAFLESRDETLDWSAADERIFEHDTETS